MYTSIDPHPIRSRLAVVAIFAGGFLLSFLLVSLAWPSHWPTSLLGLLAYWLG